MIGEPEFKTHNFERKLEVTLPMQPRSRRRIKTLDQRIASAVEEMETERRVPRHDSFLVTPSYGEYKTRGNHAVYNEHGLYPFNARTHPETTTAGIQEAHDRAHSRVFVKDGTYVLTTNCEFTKRSFHIEGESPVDTVIQQNTINTDAFTVTGRYNMIENMQFWTLLPFTSAGAAVNLNGYQSKVKYVSVGAITTRLFFWDGILLDNQYVFADHVTVANSVNSNVHIGLPTDAQIWNDQQLSHAILTNYATPTYGTAIGILLHNTSAFHLLDVVVGACSVGMSMVPGDNQGVAEGFITSVQLDSNYGKGLLIAPPPGSGEVYLLEFSNFWCNTNGQGSGFSGAQATIDNASDIWIHGGAISNGPTGGLEVLGTSSNVELFGVDINDNNQTNSTTNGYNGFNGVNYAGVYVNTTGFFRMVGGSLDNSGIGGVSVGNQACIIVSGAASPYGVYLLGVQASRGLVAGPWGTSIGPGHVLFEGGVNLLGGVSTSMSTPALPIGPGSVNAVIVSDPRKVQIQQAGMAGTAVESVFGAGPSALVTDPPMFIAWPADRIYYGFTVPSAWKWLGL